MCGRKEGGRELEVECEKWKWRRRRRRRRRVYVMCGVFEYLPPFSKLALPLLCQLQIWLLVKLIHSKCMKGVK